MLLIYIRVGQGPTALAVGAGCLNVFILVCHFYSFSLSLGYRGWLDGAKVLGKLPVPGRPTFLITVRRDWCACSRCGWGLLGHFTIIYPFSSFSLSSGDGPI